MLLVELELINNQVCVSRYNSCDHFPGNKNRVVNINIFQKSGGGSGCVNRFVIGWK